MSRLNLALGISAVLGTTSVAHAAFFNNATGLAAPDQTVTFETSDIGPNVPVRNQFATFGVTFEGAFSDPDTSLFPNMSGHRIGNFQANVGHSPAFTIDLTPSLGAIGFALVSAEGVTTFEALLKGVVVESATSATSATNATNFYGFNGIVFDQLRISVDSYDNAFLLDNLQTIWAPVPEPETWALLVAGLATVGASARRKRRGVRNPGAGDASERARPAS